MPSSWEQAQVTNHSCTLLPMRSTIKSVGCYSRNWSFNTLPVTAPVHPKVHTSEVALGAVPGKGMGNNPVLCLFDCNLQWCDLRGRKELGMMARTTQKYGFSLLPFEMLGKTQRHYLQNISSFCSFFAVSKAFLLSIHLCVHPLCHSFSARMGPFTKRPFSQFTPITQGENWFSQIHIQLVPGLN